MSSRLAIPFRAQPLVAAVALSIAPLASRTTLGCQACIPYPQATAADRLVEAETVVFARENSKRPFSYVVVKTLKGQVADDAIHLFIPSSTRRLLAVDDERVAVIVRNTAGEWNSLGIADRDYREVVEKIVLFGGEWTGHEGRQRRLQFFVDLFEHENQRIFRLAYLELGQAPYSALKQIGGAVSRDRLRDLLDRRQYMEWRPLAILLLVNSGDPDDLQLIRQSFETAERFALTRSLAALATALIEMDEASGVELLHDRYFRNPRRTREELVEVSRALSVHGSDGHTHLRDQIIECYRDLIATHPDLAPMVASDLIAWKRWELVGQVSQIVDGSSELSEGKVLSEYLALAAAAGRVP